MSSDATSGPADPVGEPDDEFLEDLWRDAVAEDDVNLVGLDPFAAEIDNVDASAWDVDASLIWGDEGGNPPVDGGEAMGLDFPI